MSSRYYYKGFECYITYLGGVGIFQGEIRLGKDLIVVQSKQKELFKYCFEVSIDNYLCMRFEKAKWPSL